MIKYSVHKADLPFEVSAPFVAIDTETMGLNIHHDRLCLIQMHMIDGASKGQTHIVHFDKKNEYPNIQNMLKNPNILKIFHFARFDMIMLMKHLHVDIAPVYCTKIASKLVRTYTDKHGLKELCKNLLKIEISKEQQQTDWGGKLCEKQYQYAASDVIHLKALKDILDERLDREGLGSIAKACFEFLPTRSRLDLMGLESRDIFSHQ